VPRKCKNAAALDQPCANAAAVHLKGPLHGACHDCAKIIAGTVHKPGNACQAPLCYNVAVLAHSRYCRTCVLEADPETLIIDVRDKDTVVSMEQDALRKTQPRQQQLQLHGDPFYLYLPRKHTTLPVYNDMPSYLPWNHCRLCFATVSLGDKESWETALTRHCKDDHNMSYYDMRRMILETEMHEGLHAIPSQVTRTCLHRYRSALSEAAFTFKACACCTKNFPAAELEMVVFPPASTQDMPAWLGSHDWTQEVWEALGERWLDDVTTCFDISTYLRVHFKTDVRLEFARDSVRRARKNCTEDSGKHELVLANAFQQRVQSYVQNMRADLVSDSVSSPTDLSGPWILWSSSASQKLMNNGQSFVEASFCKSCAAAVASKPFPEYSEDSHHRLMPLGARADGFWGGPMPEAIAALDLWHARLSVWHMFVAPFYE
jgi:hypothetical protein